MATIISSKPTQVDFKVVYDATQNFIVAGYSKSVVWIKKNGSWAYSKLGDISVLAKTHMIHSYQVGKGYVLTHKNWVIAGALVGIALWILYYLGKNQAQHLDPEPKSSIADSPKTVSKKVEKPPQEVVQTPMIKMETTLNIAKLTVAIPKEKRLAPNVSLTFCIDLSSSMQGEREKAVKAAVNKVLDSAQKVINALDEANIGIAIVGFNEESALITPAVKLIPHQGVSENTLLSRIKQQVLLMSSNGGTRIANGLEGAIHELEKMVHGDPTSTPTLILLTDGEDSIHDLQLASLHTRLAAAKVNLYAIGIGSHNKSTLQEIAANNSKGFKGTYIDTTLGEETIESAINKIYNQAIASYHDLILTSPQLGATWDLVGIPSTPLLENGQYKINLGSVSEEENFLKVIRIRPEKLTAPLELSKVSFELTYKDPKGRLGKVSLPWSPTTTIDPAIAKATSK